MKEVNKSRRALFVTALKAAAVLVPVAAVALAPEKAEAQTWRAVRRRTYRRYWW